MGARKHNGQKWIRNEKRLAIYLRDNLQCVWCGRSLEDEITLTLDHVIPHIEGGDNNEDNLITACKQCNSSRQDRPVKMFARVVAAYANQGLTQKSIIKKIERSLATPLPMDQAKLIIKKRKNLTGALDSLTK